MKVHHLNCGTIRMPGAMLVCHVLLIETGAGLVLVDSGFGTQDGAQPGRRLGPVRHFMRPTLQDNETAIAQVRSLGFDPGDVRHIVLTHFDLDHIGGLVDFPAAQVHVTAAEAHGAVHAPSARERIRYRRSQWAHGPHLVEHQPDGETWRVFSAAQPLSDIDDGIVLISLPGHTRGHAAIAVDAGHRWILHGGDAFYFQGTLDGSAVPALLRASETMLAFDRKQLRANQSRLAELYRKADPDILIVSAHDPSLLERARATA